VEGDEVRKEKGKMNNSFWLLLWFMVATFQLAHSFPARRDSSHFFHFQKAREHSQNQQHLRDPKFTMLQNSRAVFSGSRNPTTPAPTPDFVQLLSQMQTSTPDSLELELIKSKEEKEKQRKEKKLLKEKGEKFLLSFGELSKPFSSIKFSQTNQYYTLPICQDAQNGLKLETMKEEKCKMMCNKVLTETELEVLKQKINDFLVLNWEVEGLPVMAIGSQPVADTLSYQMEGFFSRIP